jgi:type VI secretion system secreted protein Hcp
MPSHLYLSVESTKFGKIAGSCVQEGHKDEMLVFAFSHEVTIPRDIATGQPSGKRQHKPLVITKELDQASPLLSQACVDGDRIKNAKLKFYRIHQGLEEHYYTVEIKNAVIVDVKDWMPNTMDPNFQHYGHMQDVSFTYEEINWTHEVAHKMGSDSWTNPKTK